MKLLFIADGRSTHTQRWVEYFAHRGYEVHLITYDPMDKPIDGVNEYVLTSRWKNYYLAFIPRQLTINRLVKKIKPDIIHAHFISKYGFHLPGINFKPTVLSAWGDDVLILPKRNSLIYYYTKRSLKFADLIYAVSNDIKDHIVNDFAINPSKIYHLPFGIDTNIFLPAINTNDQTIEVLSNRVFFEVYDIPTLIRGFAIAYNQDNRLRLTLRGEGPLEQSIRSLINSLGLSDIITLKKRTDYNEVPKDYNRSHIFITTSVSDGSPVAILEAMSSGLPCIASSVGGIPEWIDHDKNGILVPPKSPEIVAREILRLSNDPDLRNKLGVAARETIILRGEWKTLMAQVEKDYDTLIHIIK